MAFSVRRRDSLKCDGHIFCLFMHSAAKQVEGCFCNCKKQTVFVLRNNMQWTATRSEALSSKAPRVGTEKRVGTCGIVHIVNAENLRGVWR
jgi:hypothetical protein